MSNSETVLDTANRFEQSGANVDHVDKHITDFMSNMVNPTMHVLIVVIVKNTKLAISNPEP